MLLDKRKKKKSSTVLIYDVLFSCMLLLFVFLLVSTMSISYFFFVYRLFTSLNTSRPRNNGEQCVIVRSLPNQVASNVHVPTIIIIVANLFVFFFKLTVLISMCVFLSDFVFLEGLKLLYRRSRLLFLPFA